MDPTPKRNLIFESQIPPRREIWSKSLDPTRKRNLVKEPRIPPRRKFWVGKQEIKQEIRKLVIKLFPPPQQQEQQQQQLSQF